MIGRPRRRGTAGLVLTLVGAALFLGSPARDGAAQRVVRYSGKVELVDLGEGLVVVEELAEKGRRRRREVYVEADTPIVTTARLRPWQMRSTRAYQEVPVTLVDVVVGDFVVVESVEEKGRAIARRITIVERPERIR